MEYPLLTLDEIKTLFVRSLEMVILVRMNCTRVGDLPKIHCRRLLVTETTVFAHG